MSISHKGVALLLLQILCLVPFACSTAGPTAAPVTEPEPEAIARTEFTDRLENFFEYEPLEAGKPSQVRIHLTDLSDGSPVEQAQVSLTVRRNGEKAIVTETTARVGKVTGIYVADLNIPNPGEYDIDFQIKNPKMNERLALTGFKVE
jgi:hypothetical protein